MFIITTVSLNATITCCRHCINIHHRYTTSILVCPGQFAFHFHWISLRLGLDENNIVIYGLTWRNPTDDFKSSPYVLFIEQICIRFDCWSLIQSIRWNKSIRIKEIRIENVNIYIEKCSHKKDDDKKDAHMKADDNGSSGKNDTKMKIKAGKSSCSMCYSMIL